MRSEIPLRRHRSYYNNAVAASCDSHVFMAYKRHNSLFRLKCQKSFAFSTFSELFPLSRSIVIETGQLNYKYEMFMFYSRICFDSRSGDSMQSNQHEPYRQIIWGQKIRGTKLLRSHYINRWKWLWLEKSL